MQGGGGGGVPLCSLCDSLEVGCGMCKSVCLYIVVLGWLAHTCRFLSSLSCLTAPQPAARGEELSAASCLVLPLQLLQQSLHHHQGLHRWKEPLVFLFIYFFYSCKRHHDGLLYPATRAHLEEEEEDAAGMVHQPLSRSGSGCSCFPSDDAQRGAYVVV